MEDEPKEIDDGKWWMWFGTSLFVWVLGFLMLLLPAAGEILSEFIDWASFGALAMWCKMNGVEYVGKNRTLIIGAAVGMVPILDDIIPDMLISVWFIRRGYKKKRREMAQAKADQEKAQAEMKKTQNQQIVNMKKAA